MLAEYDPEDGYLEIAHLTRQPSKSWSWRLRQAFAALNGKVYADMVMFDEKETTDLIDFLIECQNNKK